MRLIQTIWANWRLVVGWSLALCGVVSFFVPSETAALFSDFSAPTIGRSLKQSAPIAVDVKGDDHSISKKQVKGTETSRDDDYCLMCGGSSALNVEESEAQIILAAFPPGDGAVDGPSYNQLSWLIDWTAENTNIAWATGIILGYLNQTMQSLFWVVLALLFFAATRRQG